MALERGKLSNVVQVAAGTTVGIITCASSKKVYIKSIICHAPGTGISTATAQVYFCPTGISSASTNKIFDVEKLDLFLNSNLYIPNIIFNFLIKSKIFLTLNILNNKLYFIRLNLYFFLSSKIFW